MNLTVDLNPTPEEASYVSNHLRNRQATTVASFDKSPGWMMMTNMEYSRFLCVIKAGEEPISLMGVVDYPEKNTGLVWVMSTNEVTKYPIAFTKEIKKLIRERCFYYDYLVSFVLLEDTNYQAFNEMIGFVYSGDVYTNRNTHHKFLRFDYTTDKGLTSMYSGEKSQ